MRPGNAHISFEQEGEHVLAWIGSSASPTPFEQDHRYAFLTGPLRQRGLDCTVEYGLSDYTVHAELPDGSTLIISPPQEPASEHPEAPESWMAARHRSAEPAVFEVIYDSGPGGLHAQYGGSVPDLVATVDARLDKLGVPSRSEQERSSEEHAAAMVLYRAGFLPDVAASDGYYYRLPPDRKGPGVQWQVVTRAFRMLQAEGFHPTGDAAFLEPNPHEMSLGDRTEARPRASPAAPSASASPRIVAALAPSPAVGQRTPPASPPTGPSAHAVSAPTRPSSAPGR